MTTYGTRSPTHSVVPSFLHSPVSGSVIEESPPLPTSYYSSNNLGCDNSKKKEVSTLLITIISKIFVSSRFIYLQTYILAEASGEPTTGK
jgi:hypothetical protein